jgi:hypothetical protein
VDVRLNNIVSPSRAGLNRAKVLIMSWAADLGIENRELRSENARLKASLAGKDEIISHLQNNVIIHRSNACDLLKALQNFQSDDCFCSEAERVRDFNGQHSIKCLEAQLAIAKVSTTG